MSKLCCVIPVLNQFPLAETAISYALHLAETDLDCVILDNASDIPFEPEMIGGKVIVLDKNIGVYPTFWEALKHTDADVLAFLHSDLIISEQGWDTRVIKAFEDNPKLGLVGFIGSNEIDVNGGRGAGTTSNFQGLKTEWHGKDGETKMWIGSPSSAHGNQNIALFKAAVVDGCAMIFRRSVLEAIKQREEFPPHHFYDRLLSCEVQELGYEVAVLGIGCDHISGQTVNQENAYSVMAKEWADRHGLTMEGVHNWDSVLYREAEKQWLAEYRDIKHFIPRRV